MSGSDSDLKRKTTKIEMKRSSSTAVNTKAENLEGRKFRSLGGRKKKSPNFKGAKGEKSIKGGSAAESGNGKQGKRKQREICQTHAKKKGGGESGKRVGRGGNEEHGYPVPSRLGPSLK